MTNRTGVFRQLFFVSLTRAGSLLCSGAPLTECFLTRRSMGYTLAGYELSYETTISTIENPAETAARFSGSQGMQERARHPAESPAGRTQAFNPDITGRRMAARTPQRLRFDRSARIKQGRDFARIRRVGERLAIGCLIANWQRLPAAAASRLGVVTGGKIGGAVVRNRARRLLRETFRVHQHDLAGPVELVLVARPSIAGQGFAEVERDFLTTLRKAGLWKQASE